MRAENSGSDMSGAASTFDSSSSAPSNSLPVTSDSSTVTTSGGSGWVEVQVGHPALDVIGSRR